MVLLWLLLIFRVIIALLVLVDSGMASCPAVPHQATNNKCVVFARTFVISAKALRGRCHLPPKLSHKCSKLEQVRSNEIVVALAVNNSQRLCSSHSCYSL